MFSTTRPGSGSGTWLILHLRRHSMAPLSWTHTSPIDMSITGLLSMSPAGTAYKNRCVTRFQGRIFAHVSRLASALLTLISIPVLICLSIISASIRLFMESCPSGAYKLASSCSSLIVSSGTMAAVGHAFLNALRMSSAFNRLLLPLVRMVRRAPPSGKDPSSCSC